MRDSSEFPQWSQKPKPRSQESQPRALCVTVCRESRREGLRARRCSGAPGPCPLLPLSPVLSVLPQLESLSVAKLRLHAAPLAGACERLHLPPPPPAPAPAHVRLSVLTHRSAQLLMCHAGFAPLCLPNHRLCHYSSGPERAFSVLTFMPSSHWTLCPLDTSDSPTLYAGPPLSLWGPSLLTCVVGDTGPLAASRGAEHVIAVHEEAFIVSPTLGIHDGDVRDDGDCTGGRG